MDGKAYFCGAAYHVSGNFGSLRSFISALPVDLTTLPYDGDAVIDAVNQSLKSMRRSAKDTVDLGDAREHVMAEDLSVIKRVLEQEDIRLALDERKDINSVLHTRIAELNRILEDAGVGHSPVEVFLVDEFPEPYQDRRFAVLAADQGDEEAFGVKPGLYFLNDILRPFYSEFLMCHEIVHVVLGAKDPELLAHGLEEGLADLLGSVIWSRELLGEKLTRNMFVYNRLSDVYDPLWEQYLDFTRAAATIYRRFGRVGLLDILAGGRSLLKSVERSMLAQDLDSISITRHQPDTEVLSLVDYLLGTYPRATVASPAAKYIARFANPGRSTREIFKASNMSPEAGLAALRELEQDFSLLGLRQDHSVVIWSDCPLYEGSLRYRL